jgi:hypothetical protein
MAIADEYHELAVGGERRRNQRRITGPVFGQGELAPGRPD